MSTETRKILEQIFTGQMPVKRNNPKPGQSPFYYVAFQSDDNNEEPIAADGAGNSGLGESSGDRTFLPAEAARISSRRSVVDRTNAGRRRAVCRRTVFFAGNRAG